MSLAVALTTAGGASAAPSDKADSLVRAALSSRVKTGWLSVVARIDGGRLDPAQAAALRRLDVDVYRHLPLVDAVALRVPRRNLERLAGLPFVLRLSADATVRKTDVFTVEHSVADDAWADYGVTGRGVSVAVLDSGVDLSQPDLAGRVTRSVSFVSGQCADPLDRVGHGTHVAGIVAGNGAASSGRSAYRTFYGIAPHSTLVSVRVLDRSGSGTVSDAIAGLQWVYNNRSALKVRVLNLSFGHEVGESYATDPLCLAVEKLWKGGVVVVCAAGNGGRLLPSPVLGLPNEGYVANYGSIQSPGNDPYVITVGAMKQTSGRRGDDQIATYSSRGPSRLDLILKPDLVAPGNKVISVMASDGALVRSAENRVMLDEYLNGVNPEDVSTAYLRLSGTSMAAPVVSGAAALLLQRYPNLTPDTVKARLMLTADKWVDGDGNADPCTFGAGFVNVAAALGSTAVATRPALSPALVRLGDGSVQIAAGGIVDANRVIWGINGVTDLRVVWGTRVIWGNSAATLSASRVIWGSAVWMDRVVWGTSTTNVDLSSIVLAGE